MTVQMDNLVGEARRIYAPVGFVELPARPGLYRNHVKRIADLTFVIVTAPLVLPAILVLALVLALQGHSPFYFSDRVGRGGRTFRMMKLRTMVRDADDMLDAYLQQNEKARREWEGKQKLAEDPRVTSFGRFLRKSSLDELPQLWNVLKGDMSLVGPRPMMPEQRAIYPGLAYYGLRPGVTGFWQISVRNGCDFSKRADFDAEYDEKLSFMTDMSVLMKTLRAVIRGTGC